MAAVGSRQARFAGRRLRRAPQQEIIDRPLFGTSFNSGGRPMVAPTPIFDRIRRGASAYAPGSVHFPWGGYNHPPLPSLTNSSINTNLYYFALGRFKLISRINCVQKGEGRRWAIAQLGRQRIWAQFRPEAIKHFYCEIVLISRIMTTGLLLLQQPHFYAWSYIQIPVFIAWMH